MYVRLSDNKMNKRLILIPVLSIMLLFQYFTKHVMQLTLKDTD